MGNTSLNSGPVTGWPYFGTSSIFLSLQLCRPNPLCKCVSISTAWRGRLSTPYVKTHCLLQEASLLRPYRGIPAAPQHTQGLTQKPQNKQTTLHLLVRQKGHTGEFTHTPELSVVQCGMLFVLPVSHAPRAVQPDVNPSSLHRHVLGRQGHMDFKCVL